MGWETVRRGVNAGASRRLVAGAIAAPMLAYWAVVAGRPLVGIGIASLVVAGERVSAAGFDLRGGFSPPSVAGGVVVAGASLGYGIHAGQPWLALLTAALVALTAWLSGPGLPRRPTRVVPGVERGEE